MSAHFDHYNQQQQAAANFWATHPDLADDTPPKRGGLRCAPLDDSGPAEIGTRPGFVFGSFFGDPALIAAQEGSPENSEILEQLRRYGRGKNLDVLVLHLRDGLDQGAIARYLGRCIRTVRDAFREINSALFLATGPKIGEKEARELLAAAIEKRPPSHGGRPQKNAKIIEPIGQYCLFNFATERQKKTRLRAPKKPVVRVDLELAA